MIKLPRGKFKFTTVADRIGPQLRKIVCELKPTDLVPQTCFERKFQPLPKNL